MNKPIELHYSPDFRSHDVQKLVHHLLAHDSVVLVGMKRVGISNFLRFFLTKPEIQDKYFQKNQFLFVQVDAHDLVEIAITPFWTLLLKRLTDAIETSGFSQKLKTKSKALFLESIQLKDTFYTYDCVQKLSRAITQENCHPVLIFTRFDRLSTVLSSEFFANLQGLKDAAGKLSYVFTSYRPLEQLAKDVFTPQSMNVFAHTLYLKPANEKDSQAVLTSLLMRYNLSLNQDEQKLLLTIAAGHVQYLHLLVLAIKDGETKNEKEFTLSTFALGESILLQSEELVSSLTDSEQQILQKAAESEHFRPTISGEISYPFLTGMIQNSAIFSPLLVEYLKQTTTHKERQSEFTRQEQQLFSFLHANLGQLVERNEIVDNVWPDQAEAGVSDWAIDRLVARLRQKLKLRNETYKIQTVVTRGYKMQKISGI